MSPGEAEDWRRRITGWAPVQRGAGGGDAERVRFAAPQRDIPLSLELCRAVRATRATPRVVVKGAGLISGEAQGGGARAEVYILHG